MYVNMEDWIPPHVKVLSGRDKGASVREKLKLDECDDTEMIIIIKFPDQLYSVNSSFFLSCFGPSIRKLGESGFRKKYIFECDTVLLKNVEDGISRASKVSDILIRSSIWPDY
jgi:hypothetical protein